VLQVQVENPVNDHLIVEIKLHVDHLLEHLFENGATFRIKGVILTYVNEPLLDKILVDVDGQLFDGCRIIGQVPLLGLDFQVEQFGQVERFVLLQKILEGHKT
jgi:hypothetical protein